MGILQIPIKIVAGIFIFFGIISGIALFEVSSWEHRPLFYLFFYLIIGLVPYLLGYMLFAGKEKFKKHFWLSLRIYTAITILFMLAIELKNYLDKQSYEKLSHPNDIYLDWIALPEPLYFTSTLSEFAALGAIMAIYITWFKVPKYVYILLPISLVLCISISWISKDDYRAIRENGIVMEIQGEYKHIPWNEIDQVALNSYIKKYNKGSTKKLKWDFTFYVESEPMALEREKIKFKTFGYTSKGLEKSLKIKKKVKAEGIPFLIEPLSDEKWEVIQREMSAEVDDDETPPKPEDFYSLWERYDY